MNDNSQSSFSGERRQILEAIADDLVNGRLRAAHAWLCRRCEEQPLLGTAWELKGLLESQLGWQQDAIRSLEAASMLAPITPLASRCLALEYYAVGKERLGIELLYSLGEFQSDPQLIRLLNHDLLRRGACSMAVDLVSKTLVQQPHSPLLWHELSASLAKLGRPAEDCLGPARRAVELQPGVACYRVTLATLLIRLDRSEEAYATVRMSRRMLCQLTCECCIWRLICVFDCFHDRHRLKVCYNHWRTLTRQAEVAQRGSCAE